MTYSPQDVRVLVHNAGFRGDDEVTMTAIVLAESTGDPGAVSKPNTDGTKDYGLAQVNSIHFGKLKLDDGFNVKGVGIPATYADAKNMLDPNLNLKAAYLLYKERGNKFGAWSTFNDGKYKKYVPQVTSGTITPKVTGNIVEDTKRVAGDAISGQWAAITNGVTSWAGKELATIGVAAGAGILIILGVVLLVAHSRAGKAIGAGAVHVASRGIV